MARVTKTTPNKTTINVRHKVLMCWGAFIASIVVGFIALSIPPAGIIDSSVLWFVAQLLLFTAAILGVNLQFQGYGLTEKLSKKKKEIESAE